jgi:hypothetical protein
MTHHDRYDANRTHPDAPIINPISSELSPNHVRAGRLIARADELRTVAGSGFTGARLPEPGEDFTPLETTT